MRGVPPPHPTPPPPRPRLTPTLTPHPTPPPHPARAQDYEAFWEAFGRNLKLGLLEDAGSKDQLAKLLRFPSSGGQGWVGGGGGGRSGLLRFPSSGGRAGCGRQKGCGWGGVGVGGR